MHRCNEKKKISEVLKERSSRKAFESPVSSLWKPCLPINCGFNVSLHFHTKTTFRERTHLLPTVCTKKLLRKSALNWRRESATPLESKANQVSRRDVAGTNRVNVSSRKSRAHHDNDDCNNVNNTETKLKDHRDVSNVSYKQLHEHQSI